ncbi:WAT1-related protein-like protein [Salvia divinorum]|uniref:WAT1-related protein-like protein n=1 Tax=Salvia divinorum TaxID=28513 RepID=A0ABD1FR34_SALDI
MGKSCSDLQELKPALVMVLVETVYSIVNVCYKLAANDGMNLSVLVGYRFMFGAAVILPIAFFAERGALGQNLYLKGLVLTSATFASAMTNLVPAITFVVAISFRLESLAWNTAAGKAKVLGTILGIGGAMVLTFYKGLELQPWSTDINLLESTVSHHDRSGLPQTEHGGQKYVLGAALSISSCLCYSLWLIIQAKAVEDYPCPYSITAMMAMAASVQGVAFALCVERDWSQWNMGLDVRLFTVAFSGIMGSAMMYSMVAWCVKRRGPLYVSIFQPLMLVIVALMGSLFLEEKLHLGMVIGAIFIVAGLYIVLWGKDKEMKTTGLTENTENEARIDIPPPQTQSDATNRAEAGAEERTESALPQNSNVDDRSCIEGMDVESQNRISNSSRREEETRLQMELSLPSEGQNECVHSGGGSNETVVVEEMGKHLRMQNDSKSSSSSRSVRVMEEQMKEVLKEMEARMAGKLEARLVADKAKIPPPPPPPPS